MHVSWAGVYPAVITPFHPDGRLDEPALQRHLELLLEAGVHGVVMLGTVGENTSLDPDEKLQTLRLTVKTVKGRAPVVTGVAENSTATACKFAAAAAAVGVDGLMALPAMVYRADEREALAHFRAVARATDLPIMVYNNPVSYGVDVTPAMLRDLADEQTVRAVKESSDNPRRITDLVNLLGDRYRLLCGVDDLAYESVLLGATGWVSGLVNAFPRENMLLWELLMAGRLDEALAVYRWYMPLLHLDTRVKLVQCIKLVMQECGLGAETVRLPRLPLRDPEREEVIAITRQALATRPSLVD